MLAEEHADPLNGRWERSLITKITDKIITKTTTVNAPVPSAWNAWTTHEGLESFFGVQNEVELCIGGKYEMYFLMNNPVGLRGSEGCKVLSYLPLKMLSFSWNAPPQYREVRESQYKTWVVLTFEEIQPDKTKVVLNHLGWPDQKTWHEVYEYFEEAWDQVFGDFELMFPLRRRGLR